MLKLSAKALERASEDPQLREWLSDYIRYSESKHHDKEANYIVVNRNLVKAVGNASAAILMGYLVDAHKYHLRLSNVNGTDMGWFYATVPTIESVLGMGRWEQESALDKLIKLNLIQMRIKQTIDGKRPVRHFRVMFAKYAELCKYA